LLQKNIGLMKIDFRAAKGSVGENLLPASGSQICLLLEKVHNGGFDKLNYHWYKALEIIFKNG